MGLQKTYINCIVIYCLNVIALNFAAAQNTLINAEVVKSLKISPLREINTPELESSPSIIGNRLFYVCGRKNVTDYNICQHILSDSAAEDQAEPNHINSASHEGPMSYDGQSGILYFTRTQNARKTASRPKKDSIVLKLRIMQATLDGDKSSVKEVNINDDQYNACHPAVSQDGQTLIFASDRPGGYGGMDLYAARAYEGKWVSVTNLGPTVNTENHEFFPGIYRDSMLVFASDRPGGAGKIDQYISLLDRGIWTDAEMLPYPFNSPQDDLGLVIMQNGQSGYFSSSRFGGLGEDDIYKWQSDKSIFNRDLIPDVHRVAVSVLDKLSLTEIPMAQIRIWPIDFGKGGITADNPSLEWLTVKENGELLFKISPGKSPDSMDIMTDLSGMASLELKQNLYYLINIQAPGYENGQLFYKASNQDDSLQVILSPLSLDVPEESTEENIALDTTPGSILVIENIYYKYDSYEISDSAVAELDLLISFMKNNPDVKILLEAHTDSRGTDAYNLTLSQKRAVSAKRYLENKGVESFRIRTLGHGEKKLRNHCRDGVKCSEKEHRYNRRTEVIVVE